MGIDVNAEMTTPSAGQPGGMTPHFAPHPDPFHHRRGGKVARIALSFDPVEIEKLETD